MFVVGHRKTGTTLLLDLLDGHAQLAALPGESNHFLTFLPRVERSSRPGRIAVEAQRWWMLRLISPSGIPPFWALGRPVGAGRKIPMPSSRGGWPRSSRVIRSRDPLGIAAVALHAAAGEGGCPARVGGEDAGPGARLDAILARYPEARFVHLLRDPRSVAAAIGRLDRATGQTTDLVEVGLTLRSSFAAAERNARRLGEIEISALRYEDLVARPEPAMRRVAGSSGSTGRTRC